MTTKDEALKQALAALEDIHPGNMTPMAEKAWDTAIATIREALAQKDEQEPDYKALWKQMCERCDYLDKIAHELQTLCDVQALRLGEHENRKPLTDEQIKGLIEEGVFFGNCKEIVRAIEAAHGIGAEHEPR